MIKNTMLPLKSLKFITPSLTSYLNFIFVDPSAYLISLLEYLTGIYCLTGIYLLNGYNKYIADELLRVLGTST